MNILVVGGAGFVGSVTCEELVKMDYNVIVLDNLYQGFRQAVHPKAKFIKGTIEDEYLLDKLFEKYMFDCVMDFAGETLVEFSMTDPYRYFKANIVDGVNLLNTMVKHKVKKFIFSSSSAIYGEAQEIPMSENHQKVPSNSYGESKYIFERILKWYYNIHGIKSISFRYFNAAGASQKYGEAHHPETHLIPLILQVALGQREKIFIFGNDYSTKDGTCIRDYTHVIDIARAHILGYESIDKICYDAFNLGNEKGYTVNEVIETAREVTGCNIPSKIVTRRPGDVAIMVASSKKAKKILNFHPKYSTLNIMIKTAWDWHRKYPNGYNE